MHLQLLVLVAVALVGAQGSISSSRIESDAAKWSDLHREYMNRAPYGPMRGQTRTKCHIMHECCPDERSRFFNLMHTHKFESVCLGDRTEGKTSDSSWSPKCKKLVRQLEDIKTGTDYGRLMKALSGIKGSDDRLKKWRSQMARVCNKEELENYYCDPDNMDLFESCQEKVLRSVARENNGRDYDAYIREMKNHYNIYNDRFSKSFRYCS